jgi:hypothetical protein
MKPEDDPTYAAGTVAPYSPFAYHESKPMKTTKAKAWMALFMSLFISATGTVVSLGLIPDRWQPTALLVTTMLTGIGTTFGVYQTPNRVINNDPPRHLVS